ncbi:DUF2513 domain-containing protein [Macrococcus bovicus]|uniref:DUF2513 domain-containing protein n=1 Tax=Macrococcus bovicus TaxID=69968 RepID=UPI0025A4E886|nr:DUF2513 domain-containing protein [Macrococcus bovicus]WJP97102.1 DUF2513 domain-containing protein [Macrococcus bovicus]
MKLNHDLVREVLLEIEEMKQFGEPLYNHDFKESKVFNIYKRDDILYTLQKLHEAGFISWTPNWASGKLITYAINDITWNGHQFLDDVRGDIVWEETKKHASKLGSVSIPVLQTVASSFINGTLGLS